MGREVKNSKLTGNSLSPLGRWALCHGQHSIFTCRIWSASCHRAFANRRLSLRSERLHSIRLRDINLGLKCLQWLLTGHPARTPVICLVGDSCQALGWLYKVTRLSHTDCRLSKPQFVKAFEARTYALIIYPDLPYAFGLPGQPNFSNHSTSLCNHVQPCATASRHRQPCDLSVPATSDRWQICRTNEVFVDSSHIHSNSLFWYGHHNRSAE